MFVNNVNVTKYCIASKHGLNYNVDIMDGQSLHTVHSSVYEFESGYIYPGPSLSFFPKQRRVTTLLLRGFDYLALVTPVGGVCTG
jgi:hypothetical protein